jgi:putative restriction endonuclease
VRVTPPLSKGGWGHEHGAKGEEEVWQEFVDHPESLAFESEQLLADRIGQPIEQVADIDTRDLPAEGIEREAMVRIRVNQSFFRRRIVSACESRCCWQVGQPALRLFARIIGRHQLNRQDAHDPIAFNDEISDQ